MTISPLLTHEDLEKYENLKLSLMGHVLVVTFNSPRHTNPFNRLMTQELTDLCHTITARCDSGATDIKTMILTGGPTRSFSVGGDFNDIKLLQTVEDVSTYISEILDAYLALLNVPIPVIAAVDEHAIGQGYQIALLADYRIGTQNTKFQMPELVHGIACPVGSLLLEFMFGRAQMCKQVLDAQVVEPGQCLALGLLNKIAEPEDLLQTAIDQAKILSAYPEVSFKQSKRICNLRFAHAIESIYQDAIRAHCASFLAKTGEAHFDTILNKSAGKDNLALSR